MPSVAVDGPLRTHEAGKEGKLRDLLREAPSTSEQLNLGRWWKVGGGADSSHSSRWPSLMATSRTNLAANVRSWRSGPSRGCAPPSSAVLAGGWGRRALATGRRRWQGGQDVAPFLAEDLSERRHQYGVGRPTEPLQTLDTSGRVIYVGSFSKTMLQALRLAFVVTPPSLSAALSAAKYVTDWHTSLPLQGAMADFIGHGWFARHSERCAPSTRRGTRRSWTHCTMRSASRGRPIVERAARLRAGARASPEQIRAVLTRASAAGVEVHELALYGNTAERSGLLFGYGAIPLEEIEEGLRRLLDCFKE